MIGQELSGRYRILEQLGAGAMGEVYLAEHMQLGRKEAIKILRAQQSASLLARFRREARAINRLNHPNIVSVYDFGQLKDGRFYLSMEYIVGDSLAAVLRRTGRLPVPRALTILAQLADAMHHAHEAGVIHRDLKPDNVMLSDHRGHPDTVKVLDFGLAKFVDPSGPDAIDISAEGEIIGTATYMAPEQFMGEDLDRRTDVYAFGCIAFELVTGEPPFTGRPAALMEAHVRQVPPTPSTLRREARIPPDLDQLILSCLAKPPAKRPSTQRQIADRIRAMPDFPDKPDTGRRNRQRLEDAPTSHATNVGTDVDDDAFSDHEPVTAILALDGAQSLRFSHLEALREAVDRMFDAGIDTVELLVPMAEAEAAVADITAQLAQVAELDRQADHVEQEARSLEAKLRFSLGELRFQDRGDHADVNQSAAALENAIRLALTRRDRRLHEISDAAVRLVAAISDREAALDDGLRTLHVAIIALSVRAPNPRVTESVAQAERILRARAVLGDRGA